MSAVTPTQNFSPLVSQGLPMAMPSSSCPTSASSVSQPTLQSPTQPQIPVLGAQTTLPATEAAQQFCLRWNSYPATVATQLAALRAAEDFVDVTLACDGRQLKAHKLVLAACSPYFMQLFKSTPCQHPVIFLRDVGFRQLIALLEFMYAGEVNVSQVELPALLRTAEALQVRGLADTNTSGQNNSNNNPGNNNTLSQQPSPTPSSKPHTGFPPYGQIVDQPVVATSDQLSDIGTTSSNTMPTVPHSSITNPATLPGVTLPTSNCDSGSLNSTPPITTSISSLTHPPSSSDDRVEKPEVSSDSRDDSISRLKTSNKENASTGDNDYSLGGYEESGKPTNFSSDGNISSTIDEGQMFSEDGLAMVDHDSMDMDLEHNGSEEESSEESDEEESDNKHFYQSDGSFGQECEGNTNGESAIAGSSILGLGMPGDSDNKEGSGTVSFKEILPANSKHNASSASGNMSMSSSSGPPSGRSRLSRSWWPPGIPYHGPQQCPYCPRVLSNVGNWRKHIMTMHVAQEKNFKCCHCTSAFRTAEYLQKHYVRVHNYPQKMTRRKFEQSPSS